MNIKKSLSAVVLGLTFLFLSAGFLLTPASAADAKTLDPAVTAKIQDLQAQIKILQNQIKDLKKNGYIINSNDGCVTLDSRMVEGTFVVDIASCEKLKSKALTITSDKLPKAGVIVPLPLDEVRQEGGLWKIRVLPELSLKNNVSFLTLNIRYGDVLQTVKINIPKQDTPPLATMIKELRERRDALLAEIKSLNVGTRVGRERNNELVRQINDIDKQLGESSSLCYYENTASGHRSCGA